MSPPVGLRPQLLDRFGLHAKIETMTDVQQRVTIATRAEAFRANPAAFLAQWAFIAANADTPFSLPPDVLEMVPSLAPSQGQLALFDTLKAAALSTPAIRNPQSAIRNSSLPRARSQDVRIKQFRQRTGLLFILAVDASGSMALNRISSAKGAAISLLQSAYVHRDKIGLISFRHDRAEIILSPGVAKARIVLKALPLRTPLSAALIEVPETKTKAGHRGTKAVELTASELKRELAVSTTDTGAAYAHDTGASSVRA